MGRVERCWGKGGGEGGGMGMEEEQCAVLSHFEIRKEERQRKETRESRRGNRERAGRKWKGH